VLAALIIVFREAIEAGLIAGIVLAATRGIPTRGRWVALGIAAGVVGACIVAAFAGELAALFEGSGQELFNAAILLFAVVMLTWHNVWMASHGRQMAQDLNAVGAAVAAGDRSLAALALVVGVAVLREGSEVVLFLYGVLAGGSSSSAVALGGALGILAGMALSAVMYFGLIAIPAKRLFAVTSGMIVLLAAGLASQAVAFLQQGGFIDVLRRPVWNSSALLKDGSLPGEFLHALIGYTARPNGAQLIAYLLVIAVMLGLMWMKRVPPKPSAKPA
jgi:high-affinity iron transporter